MTLPQMVDEICRFRSCRECPFNGENDHCMVGHLNYNSISIDETRFLIEKYLELYPENKGLVDDKYLNMVGVCATSQIDISDSDLLDVFGG